MSGLNHDGVVGPETKVPGNVADENVGIDEENIDVLGEARKIWQSNLLREIADHICFVEELEVQCYNKKKEDWVGVDGFGRKGEKEMTSKEFFPDRYRFAMRHCGPLDLVQVLDLESEHEDPDTVYIYVNLLADMAEVKVELSMSSRDLGFLDGPVRSAMAVARTGEYDKKHDVFPTVEQFEKALVKCMRMLNLNHWIGAKKRASKTAKKARVR